MANVLLAWQNRIDEATVSGGSWISTLPLSNIKNTIYQKVARSTNALTTSTQFNADFGVARPIGLVSLLAHNLSEASTFRLRGDITNSFTTPAYDSGWLEVYPIGTLPTSLLNWEDDNFWAGRLSQSDLIGLQSPFVHVLGEEKSLRYWRVEINDTANPAGYLNLGRVIFARGWRPDVNYTYGAATAYFDASPVATSLSGAQYFDERPRGRVIRFALDAMSEIEAYNYALELQRVAGITGEVLIVPDTDDVGYVPLRAFAGRLTSLQGIANTYPERFASTFEIREII